MVNLYYKVVTEVSIFRCTLTFLEDHCKEKCDYVTSSDGMQRHASTWFSRCAASVLRIGIIFIVDIFRGDSVMMGCFLGRSIIGSSRVDTQMIT